MPGNKFMRGSEFKEEKKRLTSFFKSVPELVWDARFRESVKKFKEGSSDSQEIVVDVTLLSQIVKPKTS